MAVGKLCGVGKLCIAGRLYVAGELCGGLVCVGGVWCVLARVSEFAAAAANSRNDCECNFFLSVCGPKIALK